MSVVILSIRFCPYTVEFALYGKRYGGSIENFVAEYRFGRNELPHIGLVFKNCPTRHYRRDIFLSRVPPSRGDRFHQ